VFRQGTWHRGSRNLLQTWGEGENAAGVIEGSRMPAQSKTDQNCQQLEAGKKKGGKAIRTKRDSIEVHQNLNLLMEKGSSGLMGELYKRVKDSTDEEPLIAGGEEMEILL